MVIRSIVPIDYGSYTVSDTAGSLLSFADSGSPSTQPTTSKSFQGTLETAQIRFRGDGTAPTTSEGQPMEIGQTIVLSESELAQMQFVRTGGTSGVIKGHFYCVEANVLLG